MELLEIARSSVKVVSTAGGILHCCRRLFCDQGNTGIVVNGSCHSESGIKVCILMKNTASPGKRGLWSFFREYFILLLFLILFSFRNFFSCWLIPKWSCRVLSCYFFPVSIYAREIYAFA